MLLRSLAFTSICMTSTMAQAYELDLGKTKPSIFGYNYIEAGYVSYNDQDLDGVFLDGSYDLKKNLNVTAAYRKTSGDAVDISNFQLGMGYHFKWDFTHPKRTHDLLKTMDVSALLGVESTKTTVDLPIVGKQSDAEAGIYTGAKFRNQIVPQVEVAAALVYHSGFDGYFIMSFEGLYEIAKRLHVRIAADHQDKDPFVNLFDDDSISIGIRYNFL